MGYESRLFVVEKSNSVSVFDENRKYGHVVAMVDMCKLGSGFATRFLGGNYPPTDCYIYYNDEQLTEDKYGDPLIEIPLEDLIECFESEEKEEHYRRYAPVINLLKGFDRNEWGDLVVLHYGY